MNHIFKISAEVKIYPIYQCADCGTLQTGDVDRQGKMVAFSVDELAEQLRNYRPQSAHMPTGWHYGHDRAFHCGCIDRL